MNRRTRRGFTIIEVMLFLGVSGLLIVGLLASIWGGITQQRYRDAVVSFQETLRQPYGSLVAIQNQRPANSDGCAGFRGTSDCLLLGKFLHVTSQNVAGSGASIVTMSDVIGALPTVDPGSNYLAILRAYQPQIVTANRSTSDMQWQTQMAWPTADPMNGFAMLVLRSPVTGQIHTFTWKENATPTQAVLSSAAGPINSTNENASPVICVDPNGMNVPRSGIKIQPRASTAAAVGQIANELVAAAEKC